MGLFVLVVFIVTLVILIYWGELTRPDNSIDNNEDSNPNRSDTSVSVLNDSSIEQDEISDLLNDPVLQSKLDCKQDNSLHPEVNVFYTEYETFIDKQVYLVDSFETNDVLTSEEIENLTNKTSADFSNVIIANKGNYEVASLKVCTEKNIIQYEEPLRSNILVVYPCPYVLKEYIKSLDLHIPNSNYKSRNFGGVFYRSSDEYSIVKGIADTLTDKNVEINFTVEDGDENDIHIGDGISENMTSRTKRLDKETQNFKSCYSEIKDLRKDLEFRRTYEPKISAIKYKETRHKVGNPKFSLDLHGFKKREGIYALKSFLSVLNKYGITSYSIIFGSSRGVMYEITKNIVSNKNIQGTFMKAEFFHSGSLGIYSAKSNAKVEVKDITCNVPFNYKFKEYKFHTKQNAKAPSGRNFVTRSYRLIRHQ